MTLLLGIATFIVVLAVLILVHELGHFTMAKVMGVRVEEFGLGFPPRVASWRRGETLYSLNAVPLGGFVKMLGENGEDADPRSFGSKPPWQRFLILVSGASMNLLLAFLIFFFVFLNGQPQGVTVITGISRGSPASQASLHVGDAIVAVNGTHVTYVTDLRNLIDRRLDQLVQIRVQRGTGYFTTHLTPRAHPPQDQGPMGVEMRKIVTVANRPAQAAQQSLGQIWAMVTSLPLVAQNISQHGGSGLNGPIGIAHLTTTVVQNEPNTGLSYLFWFVAFLSANLGVLNLLPIPALDGGRIFFVLLSWLRRRNLDPEIEGLVHMVGMAVLLVLIVLISYHDILHWMSGKPF